jgi:hypothetical protein
MKVTVKLIDVLRSSGYAWEKMCEDYGINPWCINEGLADEDSTQEITIEQLSEYGLVNI